MFQFTVFPWHGVIHNLPSIINQNTVCHSHKTYYLIFLNERLWETASFIKETPSSYWTTIWMIFYEEPDKRDSSTIFK